MAIVIDSKGRTERAKPSSIVRAAQAVGSRMWWIWVAFLLMLVVFAIFGEALAPPDPEITVALNNRLVRPFRTTETGFHLFGTDGLGRDVFGQIIKGARLTLFIATVAMLIGSVIGTAIGMAAGFYGGIVDRVAMRLAEAQTAMPMFLIALLLIIVMGSSIVNLLLVLPALVWPSFARIVRAETLRLRETAFIEAAVAVGATGRSIMWHHLRPNLLGRIIVLGVISTGQVILSEAGLSFLGAGVQRPDITWGALISEGRVYLAVAWWLVIFPGVFLGLTVLSLNMLGRRYTALTEEKR